MARRSLFRSTALTVAAALVLLQLVTLVTVVYFIMLPMARRSADDLAALMVLSVQTWSELPPQTRPDFELELAARHNLWLFPVNTPLPCHEHLFLPYIYLLEQALETRTGKPVQIKVTQWEQPWFWVEFPAGDKQLRIGFPKEHLGVSPPLALLLVLISTTGLTLITAVILARRISRPLAQLSAATERIGQGGTPAPLPERGPEELASLARNFNRMSLQVRELLANRTTLLAGISHDLRTPLARMRLAVEMLPQDTNPKLRDRLQNDLDLMNRLIGEFLTLSRGLESEPVQEIELGALIGDLANAARANGAQVEWQPQGPCLRKTGPLALQRILSNLIENAVRYGAGRPVTLTCSCGTEAVVIRVLDRGPGIPPEEVESVFRPFYRIESSRSSATGGSGLGLAIARQLADANGWTIELLPREGGGTEARLTLHGGPPGA